MNYKFYKQIVVIGISCRFPGANNYDEFWKNLIKCKNSVSVIPLNRWDVNRYKDNSQSTSKWGAVLDNVKRFDNGFFNIASAEAFHIDPQQRILLEEVVHCLEDANIDIRELQKNKTSVHIGTMSTDYKQRLINSKEETKRYSCLGNYGCILANRISHYQ